MHRKKPGDQVGRYVIEGFLGAGGMGEVYEALDSKLGRRVALKMLRKDAHQSAAKRLLREARIIAGFEHPNAVTLYDADEVSGELFIAMELVRGSPMRAYIGDEDIPLPRKLRWLVETARALGAAHRAGLVHRDVKPDNILIRKDGTAKVLDFGIARKTPDGEPSEASPAMNASTITAENSVVGTPSYWAPEQLRGELPNASIDQFAWAVTAFELLTGRYPWPQGEPLVLLSHILTTEPAKLSELVPDIPQAVEHSIARALSKDKSSRFEDIDEAADAIEPFAEIAVPKGRPSLPSRNSDASSNKTPTSEPALSAQSLPDKNSRTISSDAIAPSKAIAVPLISKRILSAAAAALLLVLGGIYFLQQSKARMPAALPSNEAQAPLHVSALRCENAELSSSGALDELAPAIGIGTCARLALKLGVDWQVKGNATPVQTQAELVGSDVKLSATVLGRSASATAATPIRAMNIVASKLASELRGPPLTPADLEAWGTSDESTARALIRLQRNIGLDIDAGDTESVQALLAQDSTSPFVPFLAEQLDMTPPAPDRTWLDEAMARTSRLPAARKTFFESIQAGHTKHDPELALKLSAQAYAQAPSDWLIAAYHGLLAFKYGSEEQGFAILERLFARSPSQGAAAIGMTFGDLPLKDPEREAKYLEWLAAILPESMAWGASVRHAQLAGQFEEARRRIALGLNLGTADPDEGNLSAQKARAWLPLASFEPAAAREIANQLLADPRSTFHQSGADILIASYTLEGRIDEADALSLSEIERYKDDSSTRRAIDMGFADLRQRRWLARPMPGKARMEWLSQSLDKLDTQKSKAIAFRGEFALALAALSPKEAPKILERTLSDQELFIKNHYADDKSAHDTALVKTIHLLRAARGDKAAAERWLSCTRASYVARRYVALDAGLALEATGDLAEAEKAYRIAHDPTLIDTWALQVVAARLKHAALHRRAGRTAEADKLDEFVARLWTKADAGVHEALLKLR